VRRRDNLQQVTPVILRKGDHTDWEPVSTGRRWIIIWKRNHPNSVILA